jgi:hypothetical protein
VIGIYRFKNYKKNEIAIWLSRIVTTVAFLGSTIPEVVETSDTCKAVHVD